MAPRARPLIAPGVAAQPRQPGPLVHPALVPALVRKKQRYALLRMAKHRCRFLNCRATPATPRAAPPLAVPPYFRWPPSAVRRDIDAAYAHASRSVYVPGRGAGPAQPTEVKATRPEGPAKARGCVCGFIGAQQTGPGAGEFPPIKAAATRPRSP